LNVPIYGTKQEKSIKTLRLLSKGECQTGLFPQQSERQNDRGIPNGTRLDVREAHIRTRESELSGVLTRRAGARNELIISSGNR